MSEWRPIDEAPRDGTEIVGHDILTRVSHVTEWTGYKWDDPDDHYYSEAPEFNPTHWIALPEVPRL